MRILILGGNGMIGHKMYQVISNSHLDTWILFKKSIKDVTHSEFFNEKKIIDNFDLSDFDKLYDLLNNLNPDIIINAVGITIRRGINDVASKSILINSVLPNFLNEWVVKKNKRLIHFSTDCVFSGEQGSYTESSIPDARDLYGKSKALGEVSSVNSLTLRGSMIGREIENKTELLEWVLNQNGKQINAYNKAIYSGITTIRMAKFVLKIIEDFPQIHGIYNVSSDCISKYDLIHLFVKFFNINTSIKSDTSYISKKDLDSSKFYIETGFKKPNWDDLILELKQDFQDNFKIYK